MRNIIVKMWDIAFLCQERNGIVDLKYGTFCIHLHKLGKWSLEIELIWLWKWSPTSKRLSPAFLAFSCFVRLIFLCMFLSAHFGCIEEDSLPWKCVYFFSVFLGFLRIFLLQIYLLRNYIFEVFRNVYEFLYQIIHWYIFINFGQNMTVLTKCIQNVPEMYSNICFSEPFSAFYLFQIVFFSVSFQTLQLFPQSKGTFFRLLPTFSKQFPKFATHLLRKILQSRPLRVLKFCLSSINEFAKAIKVENDLI